MKKKKIFLGAYINYLNAQNINCTSIATHLDKSKYDVKTLSISESKLIELQNVQIIKVRNTKLSIFYAFLSGLIWADVVYLPKHQTTPRILLRINKIIGTKLFTTIEGNMCNTYKRSMIDSFNGVKNMQNYFSLIPNIYGITKYIIQNARCGVKLNNHPLYLGVEKDSFLPEKKKSLKNIVFIGSLIRRKNIEEFFRLAKIFPNLNFHVIGNKKYLQISKKRKKNLKDQWENKSDKNKELEFLDNIILHGKINREDLPEKLKEVDLLFLPSRSEGFPKVILEAAASAIPSIIYHDYGASEWMTTNENGFVINSFNDVIDKINQIINNPNLLQKNSEGALNLSEKFDWKKIIKDWEEVIDNLR